MPTQEERLSNLEKITAILQERLTEGGISELNRDVTMLVGIASRQGSDIREIKAVLARVEANVSILDRGLDRVEEHIGDIEQRLSGLESHSKGFEQNVNNRFEALDGRLEAQDKKLDTQDKKLDQMLLLLTALAPKPDQEI